MAEAALIEVSATGTTAVAARMPPAVADALTAILRHLDEVNHRNDLLEDRHRRATEQLAWAQGEAERLRADARFAGWMQLAAFTLGVAVAVVLGAIAEVLGWL